jgi:hypothetical protein
MHDPVYFIFHIERTGGTTLRHILRLHYGWNSPLIYPHYNDYPGIPELKPFVLNERTDQARYFIGHEIYYGIHEVIHKPHHYLTILRDPFERMLSLYNYCRFEFKLRNEPIVSFDAWFEQWKTADQVWALMRDRTPSLEGAMEILNNMSFIGLQNTLQSDIDQIFYPYYYQEILNTISAKSKRSNLDSVSFTDSEVSKIRSVLDRDYELYQYAIDLRAKGLNNGFKFPDP